MLEDSSDREDTLSIDEAPEVVEATLAELPLMLETVTPVKVPEIEEALSVVEAALIMEELSEAESAEREAVVRE